MSEKKNKFYVYALIDPKDGEPFYIGKGTGKRAWSHLKWQDGSNPGKDERIAAIRKAGAQPTVHIIEGWLSEREALVKERLLIDEKRDTLTNIKHGCGLRQSTADYARHLLGRLKNEVTVCEEGDWPNGATVAARLRALWECRATLEGMAHG